MVSRRFGCAGGKGLATDGRCCSRERVLCRVVAQTQGELRVVIIGGTSVLTQYVRVLGGWYAGGEPASGSELTYLFWFCHPPTKEFFGGWSIVSLQE